MTAAWANLVGATLNANVSDSGGAASVTALQAQLSSMIQAVAVSALPPVTPQGRLTPTTATPIIIADVASSTVCYYTAYTGNYVPVWNGTSFTNLVFNTDLTLTLTAAAAANGIVDVFGISVGGVLTLGFGPVWATSTPGAGARGSGAGTTALQRTLGLLTNANVITLYNGASTYANIPAAQATYLGSIAVDAVAGQVTCHRTYGQSRKFGVWNAYNRVPLALKCGDPTASWSYVTSTWRQSNGAAGNSLQVFMGLAEEYITANFSQRLANAYIGIGLNSTTAPTDMYATLGALTGQIGAELMQPPALGINTLNALETGFSGATQYGTVSSMLLAANWRG
jgi:hypothetical protein